MLDNLNVTPALYNKVNLVFIQGRKDRSFVMEHRFLLLEPIETETGTQSQMG